MMRINSLGLISLFSMLGSASECVSGVNFQLQAVEMRPGETNAVMEISIFPGEEEILGWEVKLRHSPGALWVSGIETLLVADFVWFNDYAEFSEPGTIGFSVVYSLLGDRRRFLTQAGSGRVALLRFCVPASTKEGTYPVDFLTGPNAGSGDLMTYYTTLVPQDPEHPEETTAVTREPQVQGGVVRVAGAVASGGICPPDEPPSVDPKVSYGLAGPLEAAIGETFSVTWTISSNVNLVGYSAAVGFDDQVLGLRQILVNQEWFGPESFAWAHWAGASPGQVGFLLLPGLQDGSYMPSGEGRVAANMIFEVRPGVGLQETTVQFIEAAEFEFPDENIEGGINRLTTRNLVGVAISGESPDPAASALKVEVHAVGQVMALAIRPPRMFLRGDANSDNRVDLSDAVRILNFLFLSGGILPCEDAGDVDDSGGLNVTDPIVLLNFLFLQGPEPGPPGSHSAGFDPTLDDLSCRS